MTLNYYSPTSDHHNLQRDEYLATLTTLATAPAKNALIVTDKAIGVANKIEWLINKIKGFFGFEDRTEIVRVNYELLKLLRYGQNNNYLNDTFVEYLMQNLSRRPEIDQMVTSFKVNETLDKKIDQYHSAHLQDLCPSFWSRITQKKTDESDRVAASVQSIIKNPAATPEREMTKVAAEERAEDESVKIFEDLGSAIEQEDDDALRKLLTDFHNKGFTLPKENVRLLIGTLAEFGHYEEATRLARQYKDESAVVDLQLDELSWYINHSYLDSANQLISEISGKMNREQNMLYDKLKQALSQKLEHNSALDKEIAELEKTNEKMMQALEMVERLPPPPKPKPPGAPPAVPVEPPRKPKPRAVVAEGDQMVMVRPSRKKMENDPEIAIKPAPNLEKEMLELNSIALEAQAEEQLDGKQFKEAATTYLKLFKLTNDAQFKAKAAQALSLSPKPAAVEPVVLPVIEPTAPIVVPLPIAVDPPKVAAEIVAATVKLPAVPKKQTLEEYRKIYETASADEQKQIAPAYQEICIALGDKNLADANSRFTFPWNRNKYRQAAINAYKEALTLPVSSYDFINRYITAHVELGEQKEAAHLYDALRKQFPQARLTIDPSAYRLFYIEEAEQLVAKGQYDSAIARMQQGFDQTGEISGADYLMLYKIAMKKRDTRGALIQLKEAARLGAGSANDLFFLASNSVGKDKLMHLKKAYELDTKREDIAISYFDALKDEATTAMLQQDFIEAQQYLSAAMHIASNPIFKYNRHVTSSMSDLRADLQEAHLAIATSSARTLNWQEAVDHYTAAGSSARFDQARCYLRMGNMRAYQEAIAQATSVAAPTDEFAVLIECASKSTLELERIVWAGAVNHYYGIELTHRLLAEGKTREALAKIELTEAQFPANREVELLKAQVLLKMNDVSCGNRAVDILSKLYELDNSLKQVYFDASIQQANRLYERTNSLLPYIFSSRRTDQLSACFLYEEARELMPTRYIEHAPNHMEMLYCLEKYEQLGKLYELLKSQAPDQELPMYDEVLTYLAATGSAKDKVSYCQAIYEREGTASSLDQLSKAYVDYAEELLKNHNAKEALKQLKNAYYLQPNNEAVLHKLRAIYKNQAEQLEQSEAIAMMKQAITPNMRPEAEDLRKFVEIRKGEQEESDLDILKLAYERNPESRELAAMYMQRVAEEAAATQSSAIKQLESIIDPKLQTAQWRESLKAAYVARAQEELRNNNIEAADNFLLKAVQQKLEPSGELLLEAALLHLQHLGPTAKDDEHLKALELVNRALANPPEKSQEVFAKLAPMLTMIGRIRYVATIGHGGNSGYWLPFFQAAHSCYLRANQASPDALYGLILGKIEIEGVEAARPYYEQLAKVVGEDNVEQWEGQAKLSIEKMVTTVDQSIELEKSELTNRRDEVADKDKREIERVLDQLFNEPLEAKRRRHMQQNSLLDKW